MRARESTQPGALRAMAAELGWGPSMKHLALVSALILASSGVLAGRLEKAVDDPPPEPVTCPLCGGNPLLHVKLVFAIEDAVVGAILRVVRF